MNPELPDTKADIRNGRIIKTDCPISEYLASKGEKGNRILSRSDLCEIIRNPRKWHKLELTGEEIEDRSTPSTEFGSLFDCLLIQPHRFAEYYTMPPATYVNSTKQEAPWTWKSPTCREWREVQEAQGKLVCTEEHRQEAQNAVDWLLLDADQGERTKRLLANSRKQVFVIAEYHDAATKMIVHIKILTDILPDQSDPDFGKSVFDVKTALSAHPKAWTKAVFNNDLHVQAAMGLDCINSMSGEDRCDFRHLIVENTLPFEPAYRFLDEDWIKEGRRKYITALKIYCACMVGGTWPGYVDQAAFTLADGYEKCSMEPWMLGQPD